MRALLVVNPQATSTTPGGREVIAHALASNAKLSVAQTGHRGHATKIAAEAAADGIDLVVVHGGDGTVNEVVNGLLSNGIGAAPMLGVVPGGSANVFARALGLPQDPVEATHRLLQALEVGRHRTVGLGRADSRWFTFNAGLGWDAEVVASVDRMRRKRATRALYTRLTMTNYLWQAIRGPRLTVELPGREPVPGLRMVFISNTDPWSYLGNRPIRINPGCSFDGGIGVFALSSLWTPTVLRQFTQAVSKRPDPHGAKLLRDDSASLVRVSSTESVRFQVDGDLVGRRTSVEFISVPAALRVIV